MGISSSMCANEVIMSVANYIMLLIMHFTLFVHIFKLNPFTAMMSLENDQ